MILAVNITIIIAVNILINKNWSTWRWIFLYCSFCCCCAASCIYECIKDLPVLLITASILQTCTKISHNTSNTKKAMHPRPLPKYDPYGNTGMYIGLELCIGVPNWAYFLANHRDLASIAFSAALCANDVGNLFGTAPCPSYSCISLRMAAAKCPSSCLRLRTAIFKSYIWPTIVVAVFSWSVSK